MSRLLGQINPTWWMEISALIFFAMFLGIIWLAFRPSMAKQNEQRGSMPLNDDR